MEQRPCADGPEVMMSRIKQDHGVEEKADPPRGEAPSILLRGLREGERS